MSQSIHVEIKTVQREHGLWWVEVRSEEMPAANADHGPFAVEGDAETVAIQVMHHVLAAAKEAGAIKTGVVSGPLGSA